MPFIRTTRGLGALGFDASAIVSPLINLVTTGLTLGVQARLQQLERAKAERIARQQLSAAQAAQAAAEAQERAAVAEAQTSVLNVSGVGLPETVGGIQTSYLVYGAIGLGVVALLARR